ncbi:MAG TPA: anti-sigma factor [Acidimicrobiia bacterium]|nr:anti-sigma factor [Acidimicrobiia bacterium]
MNCEDFRGTYLAGENGTATEAHLAECGSCRSHRADLDMGRDAMLDPAVWEEPPPSLEHQVMALISASPPRTGATLHRLGRWAWPAAVAAVAVIVLGVYGLVQTPPPDWEITMPGTELAPGANSTVTGWTTASGTQMVLQIDGLDPAPEGYVYQLWLSRDSLHVSAGTFAAGGTIEMATGVSRAAFPRLWVTLEPVDDDESPSGHTVLDTGS